MTEGGEGCDPVGYLPLELSVYMFDRFAAWKVCQMMTVSKAWYQVLMKVPSPFRELWIGFEPRMKETYDIIGYPAFGLGRINNTVKSAQCDIVSKVLNHASYREHLRVVYLGPRFFAENKTPSELCIPIPPCVTDVVLRTTCYSEVQIKYLLKNADWVKKITRMAVCCSMHELLDCMIQSRLDPLVEVGLYSDEDGIARAQFMGTFQNVGAMDANSLKELSLLRSTDRLTFLRLIVDGTLDPVTDPSLFANITYLSVDHITQLLAPLHSLLFCCPKLKILALRFVHYNKEVTGSLVPTLNHIPTLTRLIYDGYGAFMRSRSDPKLLYVRDLQIGELSPFEHQDTAHMLDICANLENAHLTISRLAFKSPFLRSYIVHSRAKRIFLTVAYKTTSEKRYTLEDIRDALLQAKPTIYVPSSEEGGWMELDTSPKVTKRTLDTPVHNTINKKKKL